MVNDLYANSSHSPLGHIYNVLAALVVVVVVQVLVRHCDDVAAPGRDANLEDAAPTPPSRRCQEIPTWGACALGEQVKGWESGLRWRGSNHERSGGVESSSVWWGHRAWSAYSCTNPERRLFHRL